MQSLYQVDFSCMQEQFLREQEQYYLLTGAFVHLTPKNLAGQSKPLLHLDLSTIGLDELKDLHPCNCKLKVARDGQVEGFCGFFDVEFRGSATNPANVVHTLTTQPTTSTSTHWGQQIFGFFPPLEVKRGDVIDCTVTIKRQRKNHRLLQLEGHFILYGAKSEVGQPVKKDERKQNFFID